MPFTHSGIWVPRSPDGKKVDPPHWSTFVVPAVSVFVAIVSIYVAWLTFWRTDLSSRPFVIISFKQADGSPEIQDKGSTFAVGTLKLENTGNSPAFDVAYGAVNEYFACASSTEKFSLAAHANLV